MKFWTEERLAIVRTIGAVIGPIINMIGLGMLWYFRHTH